jgi:predicted RND superfamily exporter protein
MFSTLQFQADLGALLTFIFLANMVGAIVILPALVRWLMRRNEGKTATIGAHKQAA